MNKYLIFLLSLFWATISHSRSKVIIEPFLWTQSLPSQRDSVHLLAYNTQMESGQVCIIKFMIVPLEYIPPQHHHKLKFAEDSLVLFFTNSTKYPLHYDFLKSEFQIPWKREEFDDHFYKSIQRRGYAGTLTWHKDLQTPKFSNPLALRFYHGDPLKLPEIQMIYHKINQNLGSFFQTHGNHRRLFFQNEWQEEIHHDTLKKMGILSFSPEDIFSKSEVQILNNGKSCGQLKVFAKSNQDLKSILPSDIVVLESLPNWLPPNNGSISWQRQTPLAHTNLLARNRHTPNLAILDKKLQQKVLDLKNQLVLFEVKSSGYRLFRIDNLNDKRCPQTSIKKSINLSFSDSITELKDFRDIDFKQSNNFGAKTANNAELHSILRSKGPQGFGVPFAWYSQFVQENIVSKSMCKQAKMDCKNEGRSSQFCKQAYGFCKANDRKSIHEYIQLIAENSQLKNDPKWLEAQLDGLRWIIGHSPIKKWMADSLDSKVKNVFGKQKVRLRSSTNAEDLKDFSGAGLYKSVSANHIKKQKFKKPSQQIRKVWASLWNYAAWQEREIFGIPQELVRMGVCVNQAIDNEKVNGVIITKNLHTPKSSGYYVNAQKGEYSITNPMAGEQPEISIFPNTNTRPGNQIILQHSNFSPQKPLMTKHEVLDIWIYVWEVQKHFSKLYKIPSEDLALDLEFKIYGSDRKLLIKQVRPYND